MENEHKLQSVWFQNCFRLIFKPFLDCPGLAFEDWDLNYYTELFVNKVRRNPTSVECFDLAQSNR